MEKLRIWFAILGVVGQVLTAAEDGKLTAPEMVNILNSVMSAFGINLDFSGISIDFDADGNLNVTLPADLLSKMTIEFVV